MVVSDHHDNATTLEMDDGVELASRAWANTRKPAKMRSPHVAAFKRLEVLSELELVRREAARGAGEFEFQLTFSRAHVRACPGGCVIYLTTQCLDSSIKTMATRCSRKLARAAGEIRKVYHNRDVRVAQFVAGSHRLSQSCAAPAQTVNMGSAKRVIGCATFTSRQASLSREQQSAIKFTAEVTAPPKSLCSSSTPRRGTEIDARDYYVPN